MDDFSAQSTTTHSKWNRFRSKFNPLYTQQKTNSHNCCSSHELFRTPFDLTNKKRRQIARDNFYSTCIYIVQKHRRSCYIYIIYLDWICVVLCRGIILVYHPMRGRRFRVCFLPFLSGFRVKHIRTTNIFRGAKVAPRIPLAKWQHFPLSEASSMRRYSSSCLSISNTRTACGYIALNIKLFRPLLFFGVLL